jgi:hypothetical protein
VGGPPLGVTKRNTLKNTFEYPFFGDHLKPAWGHNTGDTNGRPTKGAPFGGSLEGHESGLCREIHFGGLARQSTTSGNPLSHPLGRHLGECLHTQAASLRRNPGGCDLLRNIFNSHSEAKLEVSRDENPSSFGLGFAKVGFHYRWATRRSYRGPKGV